ncbi:hypothetical protein ALC57_12749 [Trachymyrmex cornetzi]|uniref:Uncharacterized protein n=1 Tax=Trachymyrmex cornetzi TaxID=471704 RepID=A0A151J0Q3_9HYME|nr:hypothetical protein ALC57_12749 [Trachymyrmex cornetzi]
MIVIAFNDLKKKYWIENTLERKERERENRINFSYADRPHEGRLLLFIFFPCQGSRISVSYYHGDVYVNDLHTRVARSRQAKTTFLEWTLLHFNASILYPYFASLFLQTFCKLVFSSLRYSLYSGSYCYDRNLIRIKFVVLISYNGARKK